MAFNRIGFGQVEPNQLSGIKTGQIYASLPLDTEVTTLQNGEFMFYNYFDGKVTATGIVTSDASPVQLAPEPYLVYNEIKIYEPWRSYKDFAMIRVGENYVTDSAMVGRLTSANADGTTYGGGSLTESAPVGVEPQSTGDITINPAHTEYPYRMGGIAPRLVKTNVGDIMTMNMVDEAGTYEVGTILTLKKTSRNTLVLSSSGDEGLAGLMTWIVVKDYTMPDGQRGLKIQRVV